MKKLFLAALLVPVMALAQTFPSPTFNVLTLQTPLGAANGGTGVANTSTLTLGGNLVTSGGNPLTFTTTGATSITLPTSGTLATAGANSSITSLSGLTTPLSASQGGTGSTTVGAASLTATGASTAATLAARFGHNFNVVDDFGALCNGSANDTSAFQTAGASFPSGQGGVIAVPFGTCLVTGFTLPEGVSLIGQGAGASTIETTSATGNMISFVSGGSGGVSGIAQLQLASSVTRTAGAFVSSPTSVLVENVAAQGYFVGFNFVGSSPTALNVNSTLDNVTMFSPAVGAGSAAAVFENYSNAVVHHLVASGATTGQEPDEGLVFKNGDTAFVSDTNVTHHGYALAIVPGANENNFSFNAANDDFDSAGLISGGVDADSCFIAPTGNGNVYESHFSNVWCGLSLGSGALVGSLGTGVIQGMHWSDGIFDGNAINGFQIGANVSSWSVTGGVAAGNGGSGYFVGSASADWSMLGVRGGPIGDRGSNGSFGVGVSANASNNYTNIADTSGNTGGGVADLGTGTSKFVSNNGVPVFSTFSATGLISPTSTVGIKATATNDTVQAGSVGEAPTPTNLTGVALTSGNAANVASIALGAGDWLVSGVVQFVPGTGTALSGELGGISQTSATFGGLGSLYNTPIAYASGAGSVTPPPTPTVHIKLASAATVFLVGQAFFLGGTCAANGFISAIRPR